MAQQMTGPYAEVFGRDPFSFFTNVIKAARSRFINVCNRTSARTGLTTWTVKTSKGKNVRAKLKLARNADLKDTALACALWLAKKPAEFVDEARREAWNLPHGLDGTPPLDVNTGALAATPIKAPPPGEEGEPVTITVILLVVVPLLVALIPIILPPLISWVGGMLAPPTTPIPEGGEVVVDGGTGAEESIAGGLITVPTDAEGFDAVTGAKVAGVPALLVAGALVVGFLVLRKGL